MPRSPSSSTLDVERLRDAVGGRVVTPGDAGYDRARTVFYGEFEDLRPAAVARPADAHEVARVVTQTHDTGMELAVRGGGHSLVGHSTSDGGIVLDLSELTALDIDPDGRTAWAQAGLTAGAYTTAVGKYGLVTGFGDTGSVGIGGLTLGGGVGFLVRKHGLTIDNLLAAELVTADGQVLQVDDQHHPELFWAIRGGGGNFGVATRFRYRLHELPGIVGGMLLLPASAEVVAGFIAAAEAAPEELSAIAHVMVAPPMPFIPAVAHGQLVVMALMAYAGDAAAGERVLAPFRALAALYERPADRPRRQAWVDDLAAALDQGDGGAYVNFLGDDDPERVRQAYPGPPWDRLVEVKRRWDPDNLFRRNQNIPPG